MEPHIHEALQLVGKKMGFQDFEANNDGIIHIYMEDIGDIFIDIQKPYVFLYSLKSFDVIDRNLLVAALTFCQWSANNELITNPVMKDDDKLGFAIKLYFDNFTVITAEQAINKLIDLSLRLKQFS